MKTLSQILLVASTLLGGVSHLHAQGTAFTYQGRLHADGGAASGSYDFRFQLASDAPGNNYVGSPVLVNAVPASNGLFTVTLDFGGGVFTGGDFWLQVDVKTNGAASYTTLTPLQAITPTPYAITASNLSGTLPAAQLSGTVASANLAGTYANTLALSNAANSFSGIGAGLTALNAGELASGTVPDARLAANVARTNQVWLLGGNAGTTPGTHFLGTTDNQPLELEVNGARALRLEPTVNDISHSNIVNLVGGSSANSVGAGVYGATIGGGGALNYFGSAYSNRVEANFSTVSGGALNTIQTGAFYATIGGGVQNTIQTNGYKATIGGGYANTIQPYADVATIGGGYANTIQTNAQRSTIAGGDFNMIQPDAYSATIGGGSANTIQTAAFYATIGGGRANLIQIYADHSTIGGGRENTNQPNAQYATISGGAVNTIQSYAFHATIGGGVLNTIQTNANSATIGGGYQNTIQPNSGYATIGGGTVNMIETNAVSSIIGGGAQNTIQTGADYATLGGGYFNTVQPGADYATIGGGAQNAIQTNAVYTTVGGGTQNTIQTNGNFATIGGGIQNTIQPLAVFATIPGGYLNSAASYAFAAGYRAKANHQGSFVWADSQDADFASTANNQFNIRAAGGVRLSDSTPQLSFGQTVRQMITLYDSGVNSTFGIGVQGSTFYQRAGTGSGFAWYQGGTHNNAPNNAGGGNTLMLLSSGGLTVNGALVSSSDRNVKENFASVQPREMLEKVVALPLSSWNYKADTATRHVGPMAQDFYAAFNVGPDDKHIATVDADGVALAAIQGLNQKVEEKEARVTALEKELAELKQLVVKLSGKGN